ncbi:alkaline shock response membrane anchor protein AmaP [Periweissella ghanensis]|uniref:Alkaline shock response membrane anchor protein AmaP n=1 Tax=Periweissella ghanensis TaxID=467997 RepID=A0ABN8BR06_9LACO|nr:alkaline shock response membrane anchor protein AmaP [Periweissella ghanensis]MCM0600323.1 alkaline shock response membrane anchor protein AmaP [Periweissella ghanensis]CAH0419235.1 hypothetical protein WGH24286_01682 [Periweissella ghanensis]
MKKWQKFILSILLIFYAIPLAEFVWPIEFRNVLQTINQFLPRLHIPKINWSSVSFNGGLVLLGILLIIWLVILFAPITRLEVILHKDAHGELELSNKSIASYAQLAALDAGLLDPKIKIKATKHKVKLVIRATTNQANQLKPDLEASTAKINQQITDFIGDSQVHIHTKLLVDQKQAATTKRPRVV